MTAHDLPKPADVSPASVGDLTTGASASMWATDWQLASQADCRRCFTDAGGRMRVRMFLCPKCGNKRCPKATDHRQDCTGSNEPGQAGSDYCAQGKSA